MNTHAYQVGPLLPSRQARRCSMQGAGPPPGAAPGPGGRGVRPVRPHRASIFWGPKIYPQPITLHLINPTIIS